MYLDGSLSTFPEQVDRIPELYDLPASEFVNAQRYQQLKALPTLNGSEQQELNNLVERLSDFIISPTTWNRMGSMIYNVQTFFLEEVDGYIVAKQEEWSQFVKDFRLVGVHSTGTAYKFQNMVTHNGDLYLALQNVPTGIAITSTAHWQKISAKGDKGDVGLGLIFKGEWNSSTTYNLGDAVTVNSVIYYCSQNGTVGVNPPSSGSHWVLWTKTVVSPTKPQFGAQGMIWVELLD